MRGGVVGSRGATWLSSQHDRSCGMAAQRENDYATTTKKLMCYFSHNPTRYKCSTSAPRVPRSPATSTIIVARIVPFPFTGPLVLSCTHCGRISVHALHVQSLAHPSDVHLSHSLTPVSAPRTRPSSSPNTAPSAHASASPSQPPTP